MYYISQLSTSPFSTWFSTLHWDQHIHRPTDRLQEILWNMLELMRLTFSIYGFIVSFELYDHSLSPAEWTNSLYRTASVLYLSRSLKSPNNPISSQYSQSAVSLCIVMGGQNNMRLIIRSSYITFPCQSYFKPLYILPLADLLHPSPAQLPEEYLQPLKAPWVTQVQ